ncbi:MAG: DUF423 domain-containing protein [Chthoniobacterales bacterium]|nr:DUF423 domain-containing protein [Chthoniobacterales bacterium]
MSRRAALPGLFVAGLTGFLGIGLGAFGAHALKGVLEIHHAREIWNTAVLYHLVHAPVLLWLAREHSVPRIPFLCFVFGILLFSGSLYLLAVTGITWLGAVTPIGGLLLMAGWASIAWNGFRSESRAS